MGGYRGGGQGVTIPLVNHKALGFLTKPGPDPLENHSYQLEGRFLVGPSPPRPAPPRPAPPMMTRFKWYLDPLINLKRTCQS